MKSVESRYCEQRDGLFAGLAQVSRRSFFKLAGLSAAVAWGKGLFTPRSFQLVELAGGAEKKGQGGFTFAYISDTHLYEQELHDRFVRAILKAVDDVNALDPQPDFVLFGGDLAQLGQPAELKVGRDILKALKAPVRMMVGEHDWFLDMGELWKEYFGSPNYSFDHKGVHFVAIMSVQEKDFWTERGMTPMARMQTVAGLDNGVQSPFEVGPEGRAWLEQDLRTVDKKTPVVVFSHSPLYKYYRPWNFWTEDAGEVQKILQPFDTVTVIHGHTHQLLTNRLGNISFHGMLSTAWPWPYAPWGLPKLTVQVNRTDRFDQFDGCGDGAARISEAGLVDAIYNLWDRNPITVPARYVRSGGSQDPPPAAGLASHERVASEESERSMGRARTRRRVARRRSPGQRELRQAAREGGSVGPASLRSRSVAEARDQALEGGTTAAQDRRTIPNE